MSASTKLMAVAVLLLALHPCKAGISITAKRLTPPGEDEPRTHLYARRGGMKLLLPLRSVYKSRLSNADQSLWAINYHETSNFDSVDLVVQHGKGLFFIIPNLWSRIEKQLRQRRVIPNWPFGYTYFTVKNVRGTKLYCRVYGASNKNRATFSKRFSLSLLSGGSAAQPQFKFVAK